MKVIPIEGEQTVNGEKQKKFEEILSEIIIAEYVLIIICEFSTLAFLSIIMTLIMPTKNGVV